MTIGQDFYPNQGNSNIANLNDLQSMQAVDYGTQAARYADPFMDERKKYQNQLSNLMKNPGSMKSNPFYKFAYNQGLNALQRTGSVRSGNKLAALMKYGQGMASQNFFPMMDRLSSLAMSGSNPGMAGGAYAIGTQRSQDYASQAAAARNAPTGGAQAPSTPWWMQSQGATSGSQSPGWSQTTYGNSGGYSPGSGFAPTSNYSSGGMFGPVSGMSQAQLNAEASLYGLPTVDPYAYTGGGAFSGGSGYGGFDEPAYAEQDWGY